MTAVQDAVCTGCVQAALAAFNHASGSWLAGIRAVHQGLTACFTCASIEHHRPSRGGVAAAAAWPAGSAGSSLSGRCPDRSCFQRSLRSAQTSAISASELLRVTAQPKDVAAPCLLLGQRSGGRRGRASRRRSARSGQPCPHRRRRPLPAPPPPQLCCDGATRRPAGHRHGAVERLHSAQLGCAAAGARKQAVGRGA